MLEVVFEVRAFSLELENLGFGFVLDSIGMLGKVFGFWVFLFVEMEIIIYIM